MTTKMADQEPITEEQAPQEAETPAAEQTTASPGETAAEGETPAVTEDEKVPEPSEQPAEEQTEAAPAAEGGEQAAEEAGPPDTAKSGEGEPEGSADPASTNEGDPPPEGGEEPPKSAGSQKKEGEEGEQVPGDQLPADQPPADQPQVEAEEGGAKPSGEGEGEPGAESGETPADGEAPPAQGEGSPKPPAEGGEGEGDGDAKPEGETAEGEAPVGEGGEAAAPTEGDEGAEQPAGDEGEQQPQESATFAEGEKPESPVAVGEKLSREGTPTGEQADAIQEESEERMESPPVPGTPERVGSDLEDDEEEEDEEEEDYDEEEYEDEEPQYNREELIERYHQALAERQQYQEQNYQFQHKLAEYFRKKKSDDTRQDMDKNVTDQEQRYLKYMANLDELRRQDQEEREFYKEQIEELKDRCEEKREKVEDERLKFMEFKKQVALGAVNSRSGKPIIQRDIEQYLSTEARKEAEVVGVRLENIKLKNKLKKKEMQLKSKEELAEGLHLIDFEQLKIENQTYNEKIEERNEELLKLRKKITSTVQVLTHLKEKLQFVQAENHVQKGKLRDVEEHAGKKRDILSRTKQARDALRIDNQKLRQNCGLLGNEPLLRDFEERKDEGDDLKYKLDELKMQHAELTLNLNGVRRKIEQARAGAN